MNPELESSLDVDFVRARFPALTGPWTFMDNAGGSLTLGTVADRIRDYLLTTDVQHGATYEVSVRATERVAGARADLARFLNAADPCEIVFGASTTVLMKLLSRAMESRLSPGDEIIVTNADHEANIGPWLEHRARGVNVRFWNLRPGTLRLETGDLEALLNERTRLVCVTHVSNILGTIEPIAEWTKLVHDRGAQICVDGVAHAPHRRCDVRALDVDYYVFSLYKVYGPHLAVLYGKADRLLELDSVYHFFVGKEKIPVKLEPGNANYELAYGSGAIVEYLTELGKREGNGASEPDPIARAYEKIAGHEEGLSERLLSFLATKSGVRVIGETRGYRGLRVPTLSFVKEGVSSREIVLAVDPHRIGIRYGDFYVRRLIDDLDLSAQDGVVRVSLVHYNTVEEVERLIEVLETVL